MVPFKVLGKVTVVSVVDAGEHVVEDVIAVLKNEHGESIEVSMVQTWPVKMPIKAYEERLRPAKPLTMQHPLAKIEIVSFDSSFTLIFSENKETIDNFRNFYPMSQNLEQYIDSF